MSEQKKETNWKVTLASLLLGAALVLTGWATSLLGTKPVALSGATGLVSFRATSTQFSLVGGTAASVIATSSCSARIITTKANPILLTFSDSDTPNQFYGHLQAASTTVAYVSENYGCGRIRALTADGLGTTITITNEQ